VLDEPFKFVSEEYRPRVRAMLEKLSAELDVQFIMVTHVPEFKTGTIHQL
jgi:DNA repair exonuclease SbcCD ATPase subunit